MSDVEPEVEMLQCQNSSFTNQRSLIVGQPERQEHGANSGMVDVKAKFVFTNNSLSGGRLDDIRQWAEALDSNEMMMTGQEAYVVRWPLCALVETFSFSPPILTTLESPIATRIYVKPYMCSICPWRDICAESVVVPELTLSLSPEQERILISFSVTPTYVTGISHSKYCNYHTKRPNRWSPTIVFRRMTTVGRQRCQVPGLPSLCRAWNRWWKWNVSSVAVVVHFVHIASTI